jgi:hypothetical protein
MLTETSSYIPDFWNSKGKQVLGTDVTETFGEIVANKIFSDDIVKKMTFPRLRLSRLLGLGYLPHYYRQIASFIMDKSIRVYKTDENEKVDFLGVYHTSNKFIFAHKLTTSPLDQNMGTIIHEVTHAIQDWKKWKESDRDREVDGHFAGAYFMVQKKQESFLEASKYNQYISLAKKVVENSPDGKLHYFKTIEFNKKVFDLQSTINQEYISKYRYEPKKLADFHKRDRWDGIGN